MDPIFAIALLSVWMSDWLLIDWLLFDILLLSVWISDETPLLVFGISLLRVWISDETLALLVFDILLFWVFDNGWNTPSSVRCIIVQCWHYKDLCTTNVYTSYSVYNSTVKRKKPLPFWKRKWAWLTYLILSCQRLHM